MKYFIIPMLTFAGFVLAGCDNSVTLDNNQMKTVKLAGMEYAGNSGSDFVGCSGLDSDGDGYVTCTMKNRTTSVVSAMLCSYKGDAGGCKNK